MESFREALDRLTRNLVADLLDVVRAELEEDRAQQERREAKANAQAKAKQKPKPKRILRSNAPAAPENRPVVVRHFEIPVGQPKARRARVAGTPRPRRVPAPVPPKAPAVVKFEVVPHPDRKNRRMVLTRLGTA
jgi:hypothetical protein